MEFGNPDSNLGSLFAEHQELSLKKKKSNPLPPARPEPPSFLLLATKTPTFFFNTPSKKHPPVICQVLFRLADHKVLLEKTFLLQIRV